MPEVLIVGGEARGPEEGVRELDVIVAAARSCDEEGRDQYLNEPAIDSEGNKIFHCASD